MASDVFVVALVWLLPLAWAAPAHESAFGPCTSYTLNDLLHVDCSDQELTELPDDLDYTAQILDLSNNNFDTFPRQLEQFTQTVKLDMSGNRLSRALPLYMISWPYLHTLNLSDNNYDIWISDRLYESLEYLDLSKNKINKIHDNAFNGMPKLSFLDLSENRINNLQPNLFSKADHLINLVLSRNSFKSIPAFQSNSLRSLDLSNCEIENLQVDSLNGMRALLEINLAINQIESVPDSFQSNTLQEFDLSYNQINSLTDRTFSSLPNLAVLNLRGNEFRDVWASSYFASNPYLREVHVKGNRWSCEGFSVNLLLTYEFLTREPSKVPDQGSLICYSPANVTHLTWQRAYIETWHPDETTTQTYVFLAVMVGVIIGVFITSLICRGLMSINKPDPPRPVTETAALNLNGSTPQPRVESVIMRVPLHEEDLPPSYDEALLMPRLNASFHSLPDFMDEEEETSQRHRRSRSIGDLTEPRPRLNDRRSVRPTSTRKSPSTKGEGSACNSKSGFTVRARFGSDYQS